MCEVLARLRLSCCDLLFPLRSGQSATTDGIVPFLLDDVGIAIPINIGAIWIDVAEVPGALVTVFLSTRVAPGVEQWIGSGLHLLVRGDIDGQVGVVIVGTAGRLTTEACGIGHGGVNRVAAKVVVIGTERIGSALRLRTIEAEVCILLGKDKEDVVNA